MSSSLLDSLHLSWKKRWTIMVEQHYDERMKYKEKAETEKNDAVEKARLQVAGLLNTSTTSASLEEETRKIYAERDSALELIEKGYNEHLRTLSEIQQKEQADHEKAHQQAIAVRSWIEDHISLHAAGVAANAANDNVALKRDETSTTASPEREQINSTVAVQGEPTPSRQKRSSRANTSVNPFSTPSSTAVNNNEEGSRTVTFEEVYQDGQAEHKDTIVECPPDSGQWYIIKCEAHGIRFTQHPLMGAAKHLNGKEHGRMGRSHALALKHLGYRVIGCTAELALLNNTAVDEAYAKGYRPETGMRGSQSKSNLESATAPETNSPASVSSKGRENSEKMVKASPAALKSPATPKQILTNPKAFHIYNCFWRNDRCNYPVMILGWDDLTPGGLKSLAETGLLDSKSNPPHCYRYKNRNSPTDAAIVGWAPGFEDGGPKVDSRKFPAMFFDHKKEVGWVCVKWLSPFPLYDPNPPPKWNRSFNLARQWVAKIAGFASWEDFEKQGKGKQTGKEAKGTKNVSPRTPALSSNRDDSEDEPDNGNESDSDSISTRSMHSIGSQSSGVTEAELQQMRDTAGEVPGDSDYIESGRGNDVVGGDDDESGNIEGNRRSSTFYNLRETARANSRPTGSPKPAYNNTPKSIKIKFSSRGSTKLSDRLMQTHAPEKESSEAEGSKAKSPSRGQAARGTAEGTSESPDQVDDGHKSGSTTATNSHGTPTTSEAASSPSHTAQVDGSDDAGQECANNWRKDTSPSAEPTPKGTKRPRSKDGMDENGGSSESEMLKRPKTGDDNLKTLSEPAVSSSFKAKLSLGPAAFELISYSKGPISWERANEEQSMKLFYSEDDKTVGTVDAPMALVVDPMMLAALTQEKIPGDIKGNSMVILSSKDADEPPMKLVFDRAKGSKVDIGKIQVRGFIRWSKGVNPSLRLPHS